jgi:hypothetical protein
MRFMKVLPFPRLVDLRDFGIMADLERRRQWSAVMAALRWRTTAQHVALTTDGSSSRPCLAMAPNPAAPSETPETL